MSKFTGRQVDVGIAREATRGTFVTPAFWIPRTDFDFDDKVDQFRVQSGVGTLEDSEQVHVMEKYGMGSLGGEVRDKSFGLLLYAMFGTLSTSGPTDSAYTHSFSLADSVQHQSLSFVVVDPNVTERYSLVMLESLDIEADLNGVLKYTAKFIGRTGKGFSVSASYIAENKFSKKHFSLKLAATIAALSAASPISVKSFKLSFNQNTVRDSVLGTAEPEDILNRTWSCEGEFTLNYEDNTYKEYMRDTTYRAMEAKWTNTDVLIGAATRPTLTFQMPRIDLFDWEPNYGLDEIVSQKVSFKANRDLTNTLAAVSTASLINTQASY